jgi:D-serine dehydratase
MRIAEALGMHVTTESSGDERIWKYVAVVESGIDVLEYSPLYRKELVEMWRASFEKGVGVTDPHTAWCSPRSLTRKVAEKRI